VRIAIGIARALEYLHTLTPQMIHRDLKSANVLLDEADNAKVADFGTVREGVKKGGEERTATHTFTGATVGTHGYMPCGYTRVSTLALAVCSDRRYLSSAAEYISQGHVSEKTDVYAFSIVLIELLTSKLCIEINALHCDGPELFTEMERFVDARAGAWPAETVTALAALAEECISYHARARPTAREVVCGLEALL
jgi:pto-interacting protein 1